MCEFEMMWYIFGGVSPFACWAARFLAGRRTRGPRVRLARSYVDGRIAHHRGEHMTTTIRSRAAIVLVLIAIAVAGCATTAGTAGKTPSKAEDLAALADYNKRYLKSINDGDIATLSSLTSNEHTMIMPGRAPLQGKAANDEANGNAFKNNKFDEH